MDMEGSELINLACAIQDCLSKYNFNESKCQSYVLSLYKCCDIMYKTAEKKGIKEEDAKSTACPFRNIVGRKLKQMEKEL